MAASPRPSGWPDSPPAPPPWEARPTRWQLSLWQLSLWQLSLWQKCAWRRLRVVVMAGWLALVWRDAMLLSFCGVGWFDQRQASAQEPREKPPQRSAAEWVKELESGDSRRIGEAMLALEALGPRAAPVVPDLAKLLEKDREDNRRHILSILRKIGPAAKPALPAVRTMLFHGDFHTQYWACRAIGAMGEEALAAAPDLRQLMRPDHTASTRRNAALAMGQLGPDLDERSLDSLVALLRDRIHPVREEAARSLGQLGRTARPAIPELKVALVDRQRDIRSTCAGALWKITGVATPLIDPLVDELGEGHRPWEAAEVFAELGPQAESAVPRLAKLLESDNPEIRMSALEALGNIGEPSRKVVGDIEKRLMDEEEEVVEVARDTLRKLGVMVENPAKSSPEKK